MQIDQKFVIGDTGSTLHLPNGFCVTMGFNQARYRSVTPTIELSIGIVMVGYLKPFPDHADPTRIEVNPREFVGILNKVAKMRTDATLEEATYAIRTYLKVLGRAI